MGSATGAAELEKCKMNTAYKRFCVFVYATKQDKSAGEMEFTFDTVTLVEAARDASVLLDEGYYAAVIFERQSNAAPMVRVETHVNPMAGVTA